MTSNNPIVDTAEFDDDSQPLMLDIDLNLLSSMVHLLNPNPPHLPLLLLFGSDTGRCLPIPADP